MSSLFALHKYACFRVYILHRLSTQKPPSTACDNKQGNLFHSMGLYRNMHQLHLIIRYSWCMVPYRMQEKDNLENKKFKLHGQGRWKEIGGTFGSRPSTVGRHCFIFCPSSDTIVEKDQQREQEGQADKEKHSNKGVQVRVLPISAIETYSFCLLLRIPPQVPVRRSVICPSGTRHHLHLLGLQMYLAVKALFCFVFKAIIPWQKTNKKFLF